VFGRDEVGPFRCFDLKVSVRTQEEARKQLQQKLAIAEGGGSMKLEINLAENEHRYLLTAASHGRKLRSLQSFCRMFL
jgi:hypothetical protein